MDFLVLEKEQRKKCEGQLLFIIEANKLNSHSLPKTFIARVGVLGRVETELTFTQDTFGTRQSELAPLPHKEGK